MIRAKDRYCSMVSDESERGQGSGFADIQREGRPVIIRKRLTCSRRES